VKNKISAITIVSLSAALFVIGCGTTKDTTSTESDTTRYVTSAPAPQVAIVQAPMVAVVPPTTTTTSMSNDRSSDSSGLGNGSEQSTTSHHSESTTVTPSN